MDYSFTKKDASLTDDRLLAKKVRSSSFLSMMLFDIVCDLHLVDYPWLFALCFRRLLSGNFVFSFLLSIQLGNEYLVVTSRYVQNDVSTSCQGQGFQ